jgi:hypothetical protein
MVCSVQTLHLSCVKISTISNELTQASTWASSPRSTIGCIQNDIWAYGMFSTNMHLSWTDSSTISKLTKTRFHMTHFTLEFHRVRPKWFLRLWYVWHKPCTYLASRLALYLNVLNRASTCASSPRSTIRCVQNDFWACGTFGTNHAPLLQRHQYYFQMDQNEIPHDPRHHGVPSGASKMTSEAMVRSAQTVLLSCVKISNIFERSGSSFHLSLVT